MNSLDAIGPKGHARRKIWQLRPLIRITGDVRTLRGLSASKAAEHRIGEFRPGVGHRQGGTAFATLRVHDVGAGVLHVLVQGHDLLFGQRRGRWYLREEWQDSYAGMATNDGHVDPLDRDARELVDELVGTDHVQARDPADFLGIQALLLVELAHGRHDRVNRVHDEAEDSIGAELCTGLYDVLRNAGVDAEEVRPGHPWPPGQASRHEDQVAAL
mmetsp:Transcript_59281/g.158495  ORF Transcript_59281/g.158495 Transcript_59281/m.158495 type:complete len:215 (-) Transcript_59281:390-1034(-)